MRSFALVCALAACGRVNFADMHDGQTSTIDAPQLCMPLANGVTVDQCLAAFAAPASAPDQLVYDCALSCVWGHCLIFDATACSGCACPFYAKSSLVCDPMSGECGSPINGNGCLTAGFNNMPPWNCTSANGVVFEAACMMRAYQAAGAC